MISIDYKNEKPLHEQITQRFKDLVICGVLKPGDQLPSVRDLSVDLTVNPNTEQRAYKSLETEGVIYSVRGKGNFVADTREIDNKSLKKLYSSLSDLIRELAFYGETPEQILDVVNKLFEERNEK